MRGKMNRLAFSLFKNYDAMACPLKINLFSSLCSRIFPTGIAVIISMALLAYADKVGISRGR